MPTDPTTQAAQEFLAGKLNQDFEAQEARASHSGFASNADTILLGEFRALAGISRQF